jgi:hypothetical protein
MTDKGTVADPADPRRRGTRGKKIKIQTKKPTKKRVGRREAQKVETSKRHPTAGDMPSQIAHYKKIT